MLQLVKNDEKMIAQNVELSANFQSEFFGFWFAVKVFFDLIVNGII